MNWLNEKNKKTKTKHELAQDVLINLVEWLGGTWQFTVREQTYESLWCLMESGPICLFTEPKNGGQGSCGWCGFGLCCGLWSFYWAWLLLTSLWAAFQLRRSFSHNWWTYKWTGWAVVPRLNVLQGNKWYRRSSMLQRLGWNWKISPRCTSLS